jgi:hypothetical protein
VRPPSFFAAPEQRQVAYELASSLGLHEALLGRDVGVDRLAGTVAPDAIVLGRIHFRHGARDRCHCGSKRGRISHGGFNRRPDGASGGD